MERVVFFYMIDKINTFYLWILLSITTVVIPIIFFSLNFRKGSIWGGREDLQKNLQRCFGGEKECVLHHWCEEIELDKNVRSPFTSYTNLVFIFSGLAVISITYSHFYNKVDDKIVNHLREKPYLNYLQGLVFIWTGLSSFLCHASGLPIMRELDRSGVWAITIYPTLYCLLRLFDIPCRFRVYQRFVIIYLLFILGITLYHILYGNENNREGNKRATSLVYNVQPILVGCMLVLVWMENNLQPLFNCLYRNLCPRRENRTRQEMIIPWKCGYILIALILGILGYLLQDPTRIGLECNPVKLPWYHQTHGYWHICIAFAMFTIWYMFWTETVKQIL